MGFSANQARFLSLTSRQVDLEYRMQQICHRRLRLASELEKVATEYNNALSDRKLFTMDTSQSINTFTISNLTGLTDNNGQKYVVYYQNTSGSAQSLDIDKNGAATNLSLANNQSLSIAKEADLDAIYALQTGVTDASDVAWPSGVSSESDKLEYLLRSGVIQMARPADNYTQDTINTQTSGADNAIISAYNASGTYTAAGVNVLDSDSNVISFEQVDWRTMTDVADELWRANDVDAETEYEAAVEKINSQDKKLQLEQSQIEVEHKAITTQKDAVKSIITKNIESSFKTFS